MKPIRLTLMAAGLFLVATLGVCLGQMGSGTGSFGSVGQGSGGSATNLSPWTTDINAANHSLSNLTTLQGSGVSALVLTNKGIGVLIGDIGTPGLNALYGNWSLIGGSINVATNIVSNNGQFIGNGGGLTNTVPRQYNLKLDFGAACDRQESWASVTSNSVTVTTSPGTFTPSDAVGGKWLLVVNGGVTNTASRTHYDFSAQIATYISSSQVNLTAAPSNTIAGTQIIWGTPDNAALQAALNASASNACDTVILIPSGCVFSPTLQDAGAATNHHNSQVFLPKLNTSVYGYPTITIRGTSKPSGQYQREGILGTVLTSMITRPATYSQNDTPRFFDSADYTSTLAPSVQLPPWFAGAQYCRVVLENIVTEVPHDNGQILWDLYSVLQANVRNCVFVSTHGAGGLPMEPANQSRTNQVGIVFPFESSYAEHTLENCAFYSLGNGWSAVGVFKTSGNMVYGCNSGFTARDAPKAVRSFGDTFMECSNVVYLPPQVSMTLQAYGLAKINSGAFPEWSTNNWLANCPGGGLTAWFDYNEYNGLGMVSAATPQFTNSTVPGRIHWHTSGADLPDSIGGSILLNGSFRSSSDISAGMLYGEPATRDLLAATALTDNGALVPSSGLLINGNGIYGYYLVSSAWNRMHFPAIQINPSWTNRSYENFTFQIGMTNNGVVPLQVGFDIYSGTAKLASRQTTFYATNNTGGAAIITVSDQENVAITSSMTTIQPYFLWWGNAGGGSPFNATNNAFFIDGKVTFSQSADQSQ